MVATEASDGDGDDGGDDDDDDDDDDDEATAGGRAAGRPDHLREKRTRTQRNKQRRAREALAAAAAAKAERKRARQLGRLGALSSEVSKEGNALAARRAERAAAEAARPRKLGKLRYEPRRAGRPLHRPVDPSTRPPAHRFRYEPRRPDVLCTDELPSSLRALPAEASLLEDRFDSLQARNLIEPRKRALVRARPRSKRWKQVLRESHKPTRFLSPYLREEQEKPAWV